MSIRARIIGAALVVVALGSTLYSLYFLRRERAAALQRLHSTIAENERLLKVVTAGPLYDGNLEQLNANLDSFFSNPDMIALVLREYDGDIFISRERELAPHPGEEVFSQIEVTRGIDELGEIEITYSTARIEAALHESRNQLLLFSLILVTVLGLVIYLVARGLTGPIERLSSAARAMADGNLDQSIAPARAQELASLGESFIRMRDAIRARMADLAEQNEALRESGERLRLALMATSQGLYDLDLRTGKAQVSAEYVTMLGYRAGDLEETHERWLERMHPGDRERVEEEWAAFLRGERPVFASEFRQRGADGGWRWVLSLGKIVASDEAGRPLRMLGTHTDITQRKAAEQERVALEVQLQHAQKLESVGRLAGGVAHDFNNMLGVIIGQAELIQYALPPDDPNQPKLESILRAAIQSRDITRQLLAFSRKQIIAPVVLDLNELIANTTKTLGKLIGEDVELSFRPGRDLWRVKFDPSQIDQILINLAVNARDAMPRGGRLTIETSNVTLDERYCRDHPGFEPGRHVLLAVTDTGQGMDPEILEHVFEPFFTTKAMGKGTGLGLATVYGAVRQNGGFVNVYSERGRGTSFKVYVPPSGDGVVAMPDLEAEPVPRGTGRVLLVEDDPLVREITASMLGELGYEVVAADSPQAAVELCERRADPLDLLLTDVVMPGMNGTRLRDQVRSRWPDIRVLFMSGYTADVVVRHGVLEDGVEFIHKPFGLSELARRVKATLAS